MSENKICTFYPRLRRVIGLGILLGLLTSCERSQSTSLSELKLNQEKNAAAAKQDKNKAQPEHSAGVTLIDVVSQSAVPKYNQADESHQHISPNSEQQLQYIGRYHTEMSCQDSLLHCEDGDVDYILNLLPDGSAHRSIVHLGRVYSVKNGVVKTYRKDSWSYDAAHNEIIVHLIEGADLIYQLDLHQDLVLALDKTLTVDKNNNNFFENRYPAPSYAYHLKKDLRQDSK